MDDLISRQAVLDKAYELDLSDTGNDICIWVVDVTEVEKLPTAEPRTGKWIWKIGMVTCDQCLRAIRRIDCDGLLNFCPNCGARMEGSE